MEIQRCTMADYDQIVSYIQEFWGSDRTLSRHHPMFVYEFGNSAYVIKDGDQVAAYLFGFISQTEPIAYVHLVGTRAAYRRQGLARRLYNHFVEFALSRGCTELKAITTPDNTESIAFHRGLGMELTGKPNRDGIAVIKNYSGPEQDRVVFRRKLSQLGNP
jgi:GNAT superfamily N-acetyltransferase